MHLLGDKKRYQYELGDVLFYYCKDVKAYRPGVVHTIIKHGMLTYYVLEVDTGGPIYESFLHLASCMQVKTEDEL